MRFSRRIAWELGAHELFAATLAARDAGRNVLDLTVSNPTACGLRYPADLLAHLAEPAAALYHPDALGMLSARDAVSRYYIDHGAAVPSSRLCLTTSTSEAYSFLFRLLCDPGDEVLVARPSYPLFDYLASLDDVRLREYPLFYDPARGPHGGWSIDLHALEAAITDRTRAVILVHPNNPTGNYASETEAAALLDLCARRGLALIVDEVFLDFALDDASAQPTFAARETEALTFVLSGISKICGLPQMKASWIAISGPDDAVAEAMARLEVIADTFLSMNAPIQHSLPRWLAGRDSLQQQIRERLEANLHTLDELLHGSLASRLAVEGGWTVVLRVPREIAGEPFALAALLRGVLVQPGDFYGLPEGRCVLSLLTPEDTWREGLARLPI